jgi:hypothetical protein
MQGVIVEAVWMLAIITFMVALGGVAAIGALRKRRKCGETETPDNAVLNRDQNNN